MHVYLLACLDEAQEVSGKLVLAEIEGTNRKFAAARTTNKRKSDCTLRSLRRQRQNGVDDIAMRAQSLNDSSARAVSLLHDGSNVIGIESAFVDRWRGLRRNRRGSRIPGVYCE